MKQLVYICVCVGSQRWRKFGFYVEGRSLGTACFWKWKFVWLKWLINNVCHMLLDDKKLGTCLDRKSETYQDCSADFQGNPACATQELEWLGSMCALWDMGLYPGLRQLWQAISVHVSLTWAPCCLRWSSPMNSSAKDAQIAMLLKMGTKAIRIWEPTVSKGPLSYCLICSPGRNEGTSGSLLVRGPPRFQHISFWGWVALFLYIPSKGRFEARVALGSHSWHGPLLLRLCGSDGRPGPPLTLGGVGCGPWSSRLPICPGSRRSRGNGDGEGQESASVGIRQDIPLAQPPTWEIWFWGQECDKTLEYAAGFLPSMWFAGKCGHKMLEIMNWMDSPSGGPYLSLQN